MPSDLEKDRLLDSAPSETGEVTRAIRVLLNQRDADAEHTIVEHFWKRVVGLARKRLEADARLRKTVSASDMAQEALSSFFRAIEEGAYQENALQDSKSLWNLLATITSRKVLDQLRHQKVLDKRGAAVRGDSAIPVRSQGKQVTWADLAVDSSADPVRQAASAEECANTLLEVCQEFFPQLSYEEQRTAALTAEHGSAGAADQLGIGRRMAQLRMKDIRAKLAGQFPGYQDQAKGRGKL